MLVLCGNQLSNERGMVAARGAPRALCRACQRNQRARFSESGSDRPLEPDGTSAAVSIASGRTAVPFHIQDIATSFATNGQVLRDAAFKS